MLLPLLLLLSFSEVIHGGLRQQRPSGTRRYIYTCKDRRAIFKRCPDPCPPTCNEPHRPNCYKMCQQYGCECAPGFILSEIGGRCIPPQHCPGRQLRPIRYIYKCKDRHAIFKRCPNPCPPTCDEPNVRSCNKMCLRYGCECAPGFILSEIGGRCIRLQHCPVIGCNGDPNAISDDCPSMCPPTCAHPDTSNIRCIGGCDPSGCSCKPGFIFTEKGGRCIRPEECPVIGCNGDPNAICDDCPSMCPPTCAHPDTSNIRCIGGCDPSGCSCKPGFIFTEKGGRCIRPEECPDIGCNGDPNAVLSSCPSACPATCDVDSSEPRFCAAVCRGIGCVCRPGYILTTIGGICVEPEECPANGCNGDPNARPSSCPSSCPVTCDEPSTQSKVCPDACDPSGCECIPGYILTTIGGKCVKPEECPGCGGDPNAVYDSCPSSCPATCAQQDTSQQICIMMCDPSRCVCKPGYILTVKGGKCVKPEECPVIGCNGDPNAICDDCPSMCPPTCAHPDTSNIRCIGGCDPSGCSCKPGFILTEKGGRCIRPEECPVIGCNGDPNAICDDCPSMCPPTCAHPDTSNIRCIGGCDPSGCSCKPGFILTEKGGRCIRPEECPVIGCNGDPNAICDDCPSMCPPTCAHPDTSNIRCIGGCDPSGCSCKPGFILTEKGGRCIRPEECPVIGCNGDPNAICDDCPSMCPPTCAHPDTSNIRCIGGCDPSGCSCKPGFILTEKGGRCIRPEECPVIGCNGDPNAICDDCPSMCPPTCAHPDTSNIRCIGGCDPSGCSCKPGFILTEKGGRCIRPEECPVIGCNGDPNAICDDCPSMCPPTCAHPDTSNIRCIGGCDPSGCSCKPGFILTEKGGRCIRPEECPVIGCNGDPNAICDDCPSMCPPTCAHPDTSNIRCIGGCDPSGCSCKPGFILTEKGGRCIRPEECPVIGCNGDPNAICDDCPSMCPPTCAHPDTSNIRCIGGCDPSGCSCKPGFILTEKGGRCIRPEECPVIGCNGDPNAICDDCPSMCPPTCAHPDTSNIRCIGGCDPSGCSCKPGFILTEKGGRCIRPEECPVIGCNGDPNAICDDCPSMCPPTCAHPDTSNIRCIGGCDPSGCSCKPGFILTEKGGRCIRPEECPVIGCNGDPNAICDDCPSMCPPTCAHPDTSNIRCIGGCDPSGCSCKPGFILTEKGGRCIRPEECPVIGCNGDPNAIPDACPSMCPPTCAQPDTSGVACIEMCDPNGCVCKPGYILLEKGGKCVEPEQCPAKPVCGLNEIAVERRTICPPQNCEIAYTEYGCDEYKDIVEPGCDCFPNYLRNGSGICILNDDCPYPSNPVCGINEIARDCKRICPPQTCEGRFALYKCSGNITCEPGCDCVPNYLRNTEGVCVRADKCDSSPPGQCSITDECIRTCASPNPCDCPYKPATTNKDGCECIEGYILSDIGGKCIRIEDCPSNGSCNGDPHAKAKQNPLPCPSTCASPNAFPCKKMSEPIGCECEPGYLFSEIGGKCILPDDCPGGNPCPVNAVFRPCRYNCPQQYCPVDDNSDSIVCDPLPYCLSGCTCKLNYRRLSYEDETCVLASECPPVECTRPNEVWDGCPPECFSGYCSDKIYQHAVCNTLLLNCQPKCVCKKGTLRNESGICIPESECPPVCAVPHECRRTCSSPNPPSCPYEPSKTNIDGCHCAEGYILSEIGGKCIRIEECPIDGSCNGDPNARPKECPAPCPSTCEHPDAIPCRRRCEPIGCECKPGYILSNESGLCILPDHCPGGNPCGPNASVVPCKFSCATQYCPVDDSRATLICDPSPFCLSGCACNINHKWLSYDDRRCVESSTCPPVKCTRPNEVWSGCPEPCLRESCEDVGKPVYKCYTFVLNCEPKCICKKGHYRNERDICVPACDC